MWKNATVAEVLTFVSRHIPRLGAMFFLVLLTAVICGKMIDLPGWYAGNQNGAIRYPYLLDQFKQAFAHGIWYPRWLPDLNGGYGYPTFVFYQPGYFFFSLPFTYVFEDIVHAAVASLVAFMFIAVSGVYMLARLFAARWEAAALTLLFFLSLKIATALYSIWLMSMFYAAMLIPWVFFFLFKVGHAIQQKRPFLWYMAGLTLCTTAVIYMHPWITIFFALIMAVLGLAMFFSLRNNRLFLGAGITVVALSLALSSPYWFTALSLKEEVNYEKALEHKHSPLTTLDKEEVKTPPLLRWLEERGTYLSAVKLVLSVIGFYCVRHLLFFRIAFALYVLLLFMTTKWSLPLWQTIPFLQYTQFLGRLFTAVYPLQYLFIIQCVHGKAHMPRHMYAYGIKCVALLLALGVVALYNPFSITERLGGEKDLRDIMGKTRLTRPPVDYEAKKAELEKKRFLTFAAHNEFFPRTASKEGLINRLHHSLPMVEMWDVLNSTMRIAMEDNPQAPHVIKASVHANGGPYPWLIINQFDFPGWVVKVDGHAVGYADTAEELNQVVRDLDANGRIIVKFPTAGDYQLEAYYEGPPDWRLRNGAILAICVGFFAFFGVAYRRYRQNCLAQGT